jgi:hypothetical protein
MCWHTDGQKWLVSIVHSLCARFDQMRYYGSEEAKGTFLQEHYMAQFSTFIICLYLNISAPTRTGAWRTWLHLCLHFFTKNTEQKGARVCFASLWVGLSFTPTGLKCIQEYLLQFVLGCALVACIWKYLLQFGSSCFSDPLSSGHSLCPSMNGYEDVWSHAMSWHAIVGAYLNSGHITFFCVLF